MGVNLRNKLQTLIKYLLNIICLILLMLPTTPIQMAKAATDAKMYPNGNFEFTTTDTTATTNITWETIGFTVRRDESNGNPLKDKNYATFMLKEKQKREVENANGTTTVTFYLTKAQVNEALKDTTLATIKDNDILYLNGIIKVNNGTKEQDLYYTKTGIKNAEKWANADDFEDRFDVKITYKAGDEDYPVTITYQLYQSGNYIPAGNLDCGEYKNHETFTANSSNIPDSKISDGETYYLYRVYYQNLPSTKKLGNRKSTVDKNQYPEEYATELAYIRNRDFTVIGADATKGDGLNIVAIYRRYPEIPDTENAEEINKEYEETDPTAVIASDTRGDEAYDVEDGIPGTESLYVNAFTSEYMAGSTFKRIYGKNHYTVNVHITYKLRWTTTGTDSEGNETTEHHSEDVPMTYTYNIARDYSYWIISSLGVYGIENAVINNEALPGGSVTLTPSGYDLPDVEYIHSEEEEDHLIEPEDNLTVDLGSETVNSSSIPSTEYRSQAEDAVPLIQCKNDSLNFNGETIMTDEVKEEKTDAPTEIPSGMKDIGENVLYNSGLVIPVDTANSEFETTGTVNYTPIAEIEPAGVETSYEFEDINSVVVHTPTVCDAKVQSNYQDNQMISPDTGRGSLILDRPFYVKLPTTGDHINIKGYGYNDYAKYIASRQVKFPFDVYKGTSTNGTYIKKNTWTSVSSNTQFYLPTWVTEGQYTVNFRSVAINTEANDAEGNTEDLANTELENYVAADAVNVEISGRIYGLNLYDISDYPIWENVFRIPNSLSLTSFKYTVGDKDENGDSNGQNSKYTLSLVNGSHPMYSNIGVINTGYVTRFSLQTVGDMNDEDDYIRIKPTFYYVNSKGQNRQEVDIYYSETFNGKKNVMVKMGSDLDLQNKKSLITGDPYLAIPEEALNQTAQYEGVSLKEWTAQKKNIYTFTNIMIPDSLRTFIGYIANVPSGVTEQSVAESVQNWYGEYYLPSEVHVVLKGFKVEEYVKNNGGLNYNEPFWLKDGYIIVNFDIETIKDGERYLSYINADNAKKGYCNMWLREGYQYEKTDYKGNIFNFQDGDYILYSNNKSAGKDYLSAGTH